jgi:haloacetate dehalogenase
MMTTPEYAPPSAPDSDGANGKINSNQWEVGSRKYHTNLKEGHPMATGVPRRNMQRGNRRQDTAPVGSTLHFFPGFDAFRIETEGATINGIKGGRGPPLLLLHGYPQTHAEWHRVAPALAQRFTVIATDLRGYGDSSKPADGRNHEGYSKRSMARDQVAVMQRLGFPHFAVVGHDRGGRVAHRMALDHAESVSRLAVLDIVPTHRLFSSVTKEFASVYYHWFFLIQPAPIPETLIANSADFYLRNSMFRGLIPGAITEDVFTEYLRGYQNPATLHAMCEDYRAAATIDLEHDAADLGVKVRCPLLAIWGGQGAMGPLYDVLATWRERASNVRGTALPGGHWLPEQLPDELTAELIPFLSGV